MQTERETVHLIPISITKDRLLDMSNLASDMVSENKPQISFQKLRKTIKSTGGVGRIFLKFGDTIDLKQYLEQKTIGPLSYANFGSTALMITEDLIKQQEAHSPVLLNMLVAGLIL